MEGRYVLMANEVYKLLLLDANGKVEDFTTLPCYEPWYKITIAPDGKIAPCASLIKDTPLNISFKKVEDVWYGNFFNRIRKEMFLRNISEVCKACCTQKIFESNEIRQWFKKARKGNKLNMMKLKEMQLKFKEAELEDLKRVALSLETKDKKIEMLTNQISQKDGEIKHIIEEWKNMIKDLLEENKKQTEKREEEFKEFIKEWKEMVKDMLEDKERKVEELNEKLKKKEMEIEQLKKTLNEIHNSVYYKMSKKLGHIKKFFKR
jgi:hypothetical protein